MKTFVIANWKMNPSTIQEAQTLFNSVKEGLKNIRGLDKKAETVICPPFPYLSILSNIQDPKSSIKLGAQNCFWEENGSFTGEISLLMLKNLECKYVIIGHSERRLFLNETDRMINKKLKKVLEKKLKPIFCIGEKKKDKEQGKAQAILKKQLENGLKKINKKEIKNIILAYEPVWAIGGGKSCSPDEAQVMRLFLKKVISQKYSRSVANEIKILYGGSVNNSNVKSFIKEAGFQGVLVGGSSLRPEEFVELIKEVSKI